jgi:hypothetical protein
MCTGIERRHGLTYQEFVARYRDPGKPVIFTDLTKDWPALGKFSPEYFRTHHGHRPVKIGEREYKLGEFLDLLEKSTRENPAPYPCKLDMRDEFLDLANDVAPRPSVALPDRTNSRLLPRRFLGGLADLEIFIGGPGGEFPYIHYDYLGLSAYINQIYGEKEFFVYPGDQLPYLYADPARPWMSLVNNAFHPDLNRFPLFAKAEPMVVTLGPGETLYIPFGTWHTARSKTISISVAFDQLCQANWQFFTDDVVRFSYPQPWKAAIVRTMLGTAGGVLTLKERLSGWR